MGGIRFTGEQVLAPGVLELVHQGGIAGECPGRRERHRIVLRPEAIFITEPSEPALGRDARAGENE